MGIRSTLTSLFVSGVLMALIWQISDMGVFRDITENFFGKIVISVFAVIVANVVGAMLTGGK